MKTTLYNSKDKKYIKHYNRKIKNPFNAEKIIITENYIIYKNCEEELPFKNDEEEEV